MGYLKGPQTIKVNYEVLLSEVDSFRAGNVRNKLVRWHQITDDPFVLNIITAGVCLDFIPHPNLYHCDPKQVFPGKDKVVMKTEILHLQQLGVIVPTTRQLDSYISNIFATEKKDHSHRLILNLKLLNLQIRYVHFKMESLADVLNMLTPGVWMASIDLKDAYYSIPVRAGHQKYLTFYFEGGYYKFTCLPNGYSQAPMLFTKILKKVFAALRKSGHSSVIYIDDTYLQGNSYSHCTENVGATVLLLRELGFTINVDKSVLQPA